MPAVHRQSHRRLLRDFDAGPPRPVDAIVVPAGRTADHLRPAAQLAAELRCVLLVMCSPGRADPAEFAVTAAGEWPDLEWQHLTIPDDLGHPLLPGTASPRADPRDWRHGALSTKRNLALLIARMVGWTTVLMLDDDITDVDARLIHSGADRLGGAVAIGLTVDRFPDNSVVCHANRLAGGEQEVFVGASALLLDTTEPFGFFPNIYNEDWLFLYDGVAERRVGRLDRVTQRRYQPFDDTGRARAEEFGEVIAEGAMAGLHDTDPGRLLDETYWAEFLVARHDFIRSASERLVARPGVTAFRAARSLDAAERRLRTFSARRCADYVRRWRADLVVWQEGLARLRTAEDVESAAEHLGLSGSLAGLIA